MIAIPVGLAFVFFVIVLAMSGIGLAWGIVAILVLVIIGLIALFIALLPRFPE